MRSLKCFILVRLGWPMVGDFLVHQAMQLNCMAGAARPQNKIREHTFSHTEILINCRTRLLNFYNSIVKIFEHFLWMIVMKDNTLLYTYTRIPVLIVSLVAPTPNSEVFSSTYVAMMWLTLK